MWQSVIKIYIFPGCYLGPYLKKKNLVYTSGMAVSLSKLYFLYYAGVLCSGRVSKFFKIFYETYYNKTFALSFKTNSK